MCYLQGSEVANQRRVWWVIACTTNQTKKIDTASLLLSLSTTKFTLQQGKYCAKSEGRETKTISLLLHNRGQVIGSGFSAIKLSSRRQRVLFANKIMWYSECVKVTAKPYREYLVQPCDRLSIIASILVSCVIAYPLARASWRAV